MSLAHRQEHAATQQDEFRMLMVRQSSILVDIHNELREQRREMARTPTTWRPHMLMIPDAAAGPVRVAAPTDYRHSIVITNDTSSPSSVALFNNPRFDVSNLAAAWAGRTTGVMGSLDVFVLDPGDSTPPMRHTDGVYGYSLGTDKYAQLNVLETLYANLRRS